MANMKFGLFGRIFTILAVIVAIIAGMAWVGSMQDRVNTAQVLTAPVTDADWYEGNKDASVTLVEYSDFQCPTCAAYFPLTRSLLETYGDRVKLVYRHYPITQLHKNAQLAAQAAEAAGVQGKFFLMHDLLFGNQESWENETDPTNTFISYATSMGLDIPTFTADLKSEAVADAIREDVNSGNASGVAGTPTFFINGVALTRNPQGFEPFKALIDAALVSANTTEAPSSDTEAAQ